MMFDDNLKQQHTTLTSRKKPQNLKENDKEKKNNNIKCVNFTIHRFFCNAGYWTGVDCWCGGKISAFLAPKTIKLKKKAAALHDTKYQQHYIIALITRTGGSKIRTNSLFFMFNFFLRVHQNQLNEQQFNVLICIESMVAV